MSSSVGEEVLVDSCESTETCGRRTIDLGQAHTSGLDDILS
jgi:hypothetical protein